MATVSLDIRAPLRREDLPGLFARTCELLASHRPDVVLCDVTGIEPDAVCVDALARLRLAARRGQRRVFGEWLWAVGADGLAERVGAGVRVDGVVDGERGERAPVVLVERDPDQAGAAGAHARAVAGGQPGQVG
jgi:hypothetical protein